jgi:hypothetical protein
MWGKGENNFNVPGWVIGGEKLQTSRASQWSYKLQLPRNHLIPSNLLTPCLVAYATESS